MSKFFYKVSPKKDILKWLKAATEEVLAATYIEESLGSHYCVHLKVNTDKGPRVMFRTTKKIFDWIQVKELESVFINARYWSIVSLQTPETKRIVETGVPLLPLLINKYK